MGWYAAQNTRNTAFTPEEINERITKLTREDIISCAKTFKPDTVFVIRGEEEEDCDELGDRKERATGRELQRFSSPVRT